MKTLLLALAVVAFMCLGSGESSHRCFQCNHKTLQGCATPKPCKESYNTCYTVYVPEKNGELKWYMKACGRMRPTARYREIVKCCNTQECNND
uniref:3FTx-Tel2 n=1 Tax=Telescopus dhara TaxID=338837 RepID=A7X3S5_TELDH|nr:3FTx-Tel2 [Telescopus dhara]